MRALGLKAGEVIGLLMPNSLEFIELLAGASLIGVIVVPMNTRVKAFETSHILRDAEIRAVLTSSAADEYVNFKDLLFSAIKGLEDAPDPWNLKIDGFARLKAIVNSGAGTPSSMITAEALRDAAARIPIPAPSDAP